jgi:hypothetical protein
MLDVNLDGAPAPEGNNAPLNKGFRQRLQRAPPAERRSPFYTADQKLERCAVGCKPCAGGEGPRLAGARLAETLS